MDITKQEAEASLAEIQNVVFQTRSAIAHGITSQMLILWGVIWFVGYSGTQFFPRQAGFLWALLVCSGVIVSWVCGARQRRPAANANGQRIGIFWLVLFGYAAIWLILLHPTNLPTGAEWANYHPLNDRQIGAFFATVPMFGYVVGGLWLSRFFIWLGLTVTALTLVGYFLLPEYFNLWMAFTAGGSLILAGLFIRKTWR